MQFNVKLLKLPQHLLSNIVGNFTIMILSFIKSVLIVRIATPYFFGIYQYKFAIFSSLFVFSSTLDFTFLRFFNSEETKPEIFWGHALVKISFLIFSIILCQGYLTFAFDDSHNIPAILIIAIVAQINSANFKTLFACIFSLTEEYRLLNAIEVLFLLLWIVLIWVINYYFKIDGVTFLTLTSSLAIVVDLAFMIYSYIHFHKIFKTLKYPGFKRSLKIGLYKYKAYFMPYLGSEVAGYMKNYVPSLIFGVKGDFAAYSYFHVVRKIFFTIHKTFPKILKNMLPTILKHRTRKDFWVKWNEYFTKYLFFIFTSITVLLFCLPFILNYFYKINPLDINHFTLFLFSLNLIFGVIAFSNTMFLQTETNTIPFFWGTIVTNITWVFLLFVATMFQGQREPIIASIPTISTILTHSYLVYELKKKSPDILTLNLKLFKIAFIFSVIVYFFSSNFLALFNLFLKFIN